MSKTKLQFILIILIYLSAHSFFNPFGLIPSQLGKAIFYVFSLIGLFVAIKYGKGKQTHYPKKSYRWIIGGIIVSIFSVWLIYGQPFKVSVITTLPILFSYLYFFILIRLQPEKEKLFRFLVIMTVCSFVIYVVNALTVPNIVFGTGKDEYDTSRGVIRLGVSMIEVVVLMLLYSVNQWLLSGKRKWFLWIALTGFLVVMSVTRQIILLSFAFSFLLIMQRAKLWKKILVLAGLWLFVSYILPEIPIYKSMMELSESQVERNKYEEEDIRITAWRFYTIEYQKNLLTRIVGNGLPSIGNSRHGDEFGSMINYEYGGNGCFYVDVGWAGFYWLFGIFATVGLACLLVKSAKTSLRQNHHYLFYWFLFILISSVASAPIIFSFQVVSLCICLYLVYGEDDGRRCLSSNKDYLAV